MKKNNEGSLVKITANFGELKDHGQQLGDRYKPMAPELSLPQLTTQQTEANEMVKQMITAERNWKSAAVDRRIIFEPFKKLCTRIVRAMKAMGIDKETMAQARSIVRKIRGTRTGKPRKKKGEKAPEEQIQQAENGAATPESEVAKTISVAQTGYVELVNHFSELLELLADIEIYKPNEADLALDSLVKLRDEMREHNTAASWAGTAYVHTLMKRNIIFYTGKNSVCVIALRVKDYIMSVYGARSPESSKVGKLQFRNPMISK